MRITTQLNNDQLLRNAPSIFTNDSAVRTSSKYQHISTEQIVNGLEKIGYGVFSARQSATRLADKRLFAKHELRFRPIGCAPTVGGLFPEIVLINSHDGLSSYRLMAGIYRLVCSNGLISGQTSAEVRVRHQGDILGDVIEGSYEVIESAHGMIGMANQMERIELAPKERILLAEAAHAIRFKEDDEMGKIITPDQLLSVRRRDELSKNDLFTTFNIVQENVIKGGLRGWGRDSKGYRKRVSTRAVKSIDQNTSLNRALWTLAEKMMELKA